MNQFLMVRSTDRFWPDINWEMQIWNWCPMGSFDSCMTFKISSNLFQIFIYLSDRHAYKILSWCVCWCINIKIILDIKTDLIFKGSEKSNMRNNWKDFFIYHKFYAIREKAHRIVSVPNIRVEVKKYRTKWMPAPSQTIGINDRCDCARKGMECHSTDRQRWHLKPFCLK